ncbi:MAG: cytochrome c biogenesis protein CcsA [Mariniblastus sp.]
MEWLDKISITCFAASYIVVFALEISRVFFDASIQKFVRVGFAAAGLVAHTVYLVMQGTLEINAAGIWLNSWFAWCLATAWVLAAAYLWISIRQSKSVFGLFLLPLVLILISLGIQFGSKNLFSDGRAKTIWNMVHGSSLLLGTAVVVLGFAFGIVYLIQANRLKRKLPQSKHFRLPSLEWLQKSSESSLVASTVLLAIGLISGIAINLINRSSESGAGSAIAWSDPVIWSSAVLFLWLLTVSIFSFVYQPARQGRKVAYLVVTCFLFLVLELMIVWWAGHASNSNNQTASDRQNYSFLFPLFDHSPNKPANGDGLEVRS